MCTFQLHIRIWPLGQIENCPIQVAIVMNHTYCHFKFHKLSEDTKAMRGHSFQVTTQVVPLVWTIEPKKKKEKGKWVFYIDMQCLFSNSYPCLRRHGRHGHGRHKGGLLPLFLTIESRMVSIYEAYSPISLCYMSFWCPFITRSLANTTQI